MPYAVKSIKQPYQPTQEILSMMKIFTEMVNKVIMIGLANNTSTLYKLSKLAYHELNQYDIPSYYKLSAISEARGKLALRKRQIKKGIKSKPPFIIKPHLTTCYGFKVNWMMFSIPASRGQKIMIPLNWYIAAKVSKNGLEPRSFTITPRSLSISVRKKVEEITPQNAIGIDRNLRNVTASTCYGPKMYRMDKIHTIRNNAKYVLAAFRRYDVRVKKGYQQRLLSRVARRRRQQLHKISKSIVHVAKETRSIIVFEDLTGISRLYRRGNGQGRKYRGMMNWWPHYLFVRMVLYKASWEGIPVLFVDPKRTSKICPVCGERIQEDRLSRRKVLCLNCNKQMDRDVLASMNIACKGWSRFCHPRGLPSEAVNKNLAYTQPVILRVDGSKLVALSDIGKN